MMRNVERAIPPDVAATLRLWGLRWFGVAAGAVLTAGAFRFATGGPTIHDWEPPVAGLAAIALAIGGATALRWEGLAAVWLAFLGVVAGVAVSAHYGPLAGLIPVVALLPAAVALFLACRLVRSPRGLAVFAVVVAGVLAAGGFAASVAYDSVFGPSHPASATLAPAASPVTWMWAGAVGTDGFTVVARVEAAGEAKLLLAESGTETWHRTVTAPLVDGVVRFEVSGLSSGTDFRYAVEAAGGLGPQGELATFPSGPADLTIAFSSCARTGSNGAVFDAIRETDADLYIITGDLFYGDIGPNDPEAFRDAYSEALSRPAQSALYRSTPVAYVWDDHDYSQNDADASAASRPAAMAVYREFAPHYGLAGDNTPIHQAFTIGRVRVIMTDNRAARDAELATVLGSLQYDWLAAELTDAVGRYPLVVWVNPDPWIAGVDAGADHWGAFEDERRRLSELIADLDFRGFLMLSGDAHMVAIDDGTNNTYGGAGPGFPVFHAGALDRPGSEKGGPYSAGAFPGGGQFGVIEIDDDGGVLNVRLSGRDWTGEEIVAYRFATELR